LVVFVVVLFVILVEIQVVVVGLAELVVLRVVDVGLLVLFVLVVAEIVVAQVVDEIVGLLVVLVLFLFVLLLVLVLVLVVLGVGLDLPGGRAEEWIGEHGVPFHLGPYYPRHVRPGKGPVLRFGGGHAGLHRRPHHRR